MIMRLFPISITKKQQSNYNNSAGPAATKLYFTKVSN
jgi:hypothetical protein